MNQVVEITQSFDLSPPMVEILIWLTQKQVNSLDNRLTYYSGELDQEGFSQDVVNQLYRLGLIKFFGLSADLSATGKLVTEKLKNQ